MVKVLAPAGSEEVAYAVLDAGADAVYVAPAEWSRRVATFGLDDDGLRRCIEYATAHGRELRVPLNAFYRQEDLSPLLKKIERYVAWGATGIIAADLGLMREIRRCFPTTRLYASAACGVSSVDEALFFKDLGVWEVVAPYNLTPEEMARIQREADIGVEAFAHGHLDYHQCGFCWMSTYFHREVYEDAKERPYVIGSVNRGGGCFRVCRAGWNLVNAQGTVVHSDHLQEGRTFYFYYGLDRLGQYVQANVTSLKIMGRDYNIEFAVRITQLYRRLVDRAMRDPAAYAPTSEDEAEAKAIERIRSQIWDARCRALHERTPLKACAAAGAAF